MILLSHCAVGPIFPVDYASLTEPPCPALAVLTYLTVVWLWKKDYRQQEALLFA